MREKSKWICEGFRKRDIFPTLHWASELSTELLACVKRYTDVIEIDTAMLRERREQLSILHRHTPPLNAHAHLHTHSPLKSSQSKLTARNREEKSKTIFFFLFLKKSKSNCQLSEDYSTTVGSPTSPP